MKSAARSHRPARLVAFTLVELLVATAVFSLLLVLMLSVLTQTTNVWRSASRRVEVFQSARVAFDLMTRNLSQATLNTYLDYDSATAPTTYLRKSELRFVCGPAGATGATALPGTANTGQAVFFSAPASYSLDPANFGGMDGLLNSCGYFVSFSQAKNLPAHVTAAGTPLVYRYRLMQLLVPAESKNAYAAGYNASAASKGWITSYTANNSANKTRVVADNVIALIIRPQDPGSTLADLTTNYYYDSYYTFTAGAPQPDSANQLPPILQVTMIAIDEDSAKRLQNGATQPPAIVLALANRFKDPVQYQVDIDAVELALRTAGVQYRIFTSAVPMRESKWTK